jgi:hypothetical protein
LDFLNNTFIFIHKCYHINFLKLRVIFYNHIKIYCYDKISTDTIKLYPAPSATDCTLASGLKIKFKRTADLFTSAQVTTGTKEPGIASPFHILIAYMAAIPYCMSYKKDRVNLYQRQVEILTKDMLSHYALREKDVKNIMTTAPIRNGRGWR